MDTLLVDATPATAAAHAKPRQFVTFTATGRRYGVDVMSVIEIRSWAPTTRLPDSPDAARGVMDIRGSIVEVFDLASMLGDPPSRTSPDQVVLIVTVGDAPVGLLVDTVSDIVSPDLGDFRPPPHIGYGPGIVETRVSALIKSDDLLVAIIDLEALFTVGVKTWI